MRLIPVYAAEKADGIADLIRSNTKIAYASLVKPATRPVRSTVVARLEQARATNLDQPDLHYMEDILVSTGWNLNDEFFLPLEVWAARKTPEDKPLNFEHECDDIIGHITDCTPVDTDYKPIDENIAADEVPDRFHILTASVLYLHWAKEDLQKRMDQLVQEVAEGHWYVSMEALFPDFDYAIEETNGSVQIVSRNSKTAFLTKYLRAYGGKGVYESRRIGRAIKNFVFSGKGLVRKPANPDSIIFPDASPIFSEISADLGYEVAASVKEENQIMAKEINEDLQAQLDALKAELAQRDEAATLLKSANDELQAAVAAFKAKEPQFEAIASENASLKEQLAAIAAEQKRQSRVATVREKLGHDEAKASLYVAKLEKLDDTEFAEFVATAASDYEAAKQAAYKEAKPQPPTQVEVTVPATPKIQLPPTMGKVAPKATSAPVAPRVTAEVLNGVVPNQTPALAVASETNTRVAKVRDEVLQYFGCSTNEEK